MGRVVQVCMPYSVQPQVSLYWLVAFDEARPCRTGCAHPQDAPAPVVVEPPEPPAPSLCVFEAQLDAPDGTPLSQYTPELGGPMTIVGPEPTIESYQGSKVMRAPGTAIWGGFYVPAAADVGTELIAWLGGSDDSAAMIRLRDSDQGAPAGTNAIVVTLVRGRFTIDDNGVNLVDESFTFEDFQKVRIDVEGTQLAYALEDGQQNAIASGTVTVAAGADTDFAVLTKNPGDPISEVYAPLFACPPGEIPAPEPPTPGAEVGRFTQTPVEETLRLAGDGRVSQTVLEETRAVAGGAGRVSQHVLVEIRQSDEY